MAGISEEVPGLTKVFGVLSRNKKLFWKYGLDTRIFRTLWSPTFLPVCSSLPFLSLEYWITQQIGIEYLCMPGTLPAGSDSPVTRQRLCPHGAYMLVEGRKQQVNIFCQAELGEGLEGRGTAFHEVICTQPSVRRQHSGRDLEAVREGLPWAGIWERHPRQRDHQAGPHAWHGMLAEEQGALSDCGGRQRVEGAEVREQVGKEEGTNQAGPCEFL